MWREVHKQHLEVQSDPISIHKRNKIFLCLSFWLSFHTLLVFHSFSCVYLYISVYDCVCGCDLVIVDGMITGPSVLLAPWRKHICSKSQSLHKHTPRLPLTRCIMSVLCPIDQMTITVEPWRRLQKVHLSLFGPRDASEIQTHKPVAQLQSHTEAPAHYPCKERGEWTTHKALTERHAVWGEIEMGKGREGRLRKRNGEQEEEDVGSWSN